MENAQTTAAVTLLDRSLIEDRQTPFSNLIYHVLALQDECNPAQRNTVAYDFAMLAEDILQHHFKCPIVKVNNREAIIIQPINIGHVYDESHSYFVSRSGMIIGQIDLVTFNLDEMVCFRSIANPYILLLAYANV